MTRAEVARGFHELKDDLGRLGELVNDKATCDAQARQLLPRVDELRQGVNGLSTEKEELNGCFTTAVECLLCKPDSKASCDLFAFFADEAVSGNTRALKNEIDAGSHKSW